MTTTLTLPTAELAKAISSIEASRASGKSFHFVSADKFMFGTIKSLSERYCLVRGWNSYTIHEQRVQLYGYTIALNESKTGIYNTI